MNVVGIDPGKTGGIAIYKDHPSPNGWIPVLKTYALEYLTESEVLEILRQAAPATTFLEKVSSSPQQGVVSAFSFGEVFGSLRMAAIAAGHRVQLVTPLKWQSAMKLKRIGGGYGKNDTQKKRRNREMAQQLHPGLKVTNAIADAILICEYGRLSGIKLPNPGANS